MGVKCRIFRVFYGSYRTLHKDRKYGETLDDKILRIFIGITDTMVQREKCECHIRDIVRANVVH